MPEFRFDPLRRSWVSFAPERQTRPRDYAEDGTPLNSSTQDACPFCRGHEARTPTATHTVFATHEVSSSNENWQVRIVPNSYPAAATHEVIIESPEHHTRMSQLDEAQFRHIVQAYHGRLNELRHDDGIAHVSLWKNSGAAAGASLSHVHSQLMATPFVSSAVQRELDLAIACRRDHQPCPWCELVATELLAAQRVVHESDHFIAFCPFASRFVAEMWIIPRRHMAHFEELNRIECDDFSRTLRRCLVALELEFPEAAYNAALHTAPFRVADRDAFHWHFEIMPRVNGLAGFELGSENAINTVFPEDAAARLRNGGSLPFLLSGLLTEPQDARPKTLP